MGGRRRERDGSDELVKVKNLHSALYTLRYALCTCTISVAKKLQPFLESPRHWNFFPVNRKEISWIRGKKAVERNFSGMHLPCVFGIVARKPQTLLCFRKCRADLRSSIRANGPTRY